MDQKPYHLSRSERGLVLTALAAFVLVAFAPSMAAEKKSADNGWEFSVAPYMWAISMDGNVTVKGLKADLDVGFNEVLDELNFGVMLAYEARKDKWGLWGNTIYANLGDSDVSGPIGLTKIDPTVNALWQGLGGFYRLGTWDLAEASRKKTPSVTVDAYAGARYTYLDVEVDFKGAFQNRFNNIDKSESWVEPLVGTRTIWNLSERLTVTLTGDIGGFGAGSDFAWDALCLIDYRLTLFGNDNTRVIVGYRGLSQDYTDGSGKNKFQWDVIIHGPISGLLIRF